jgi:2-polyprenyl-6-methoxyphenol hydroxylase-like FAD-dependent oxidoreductase
MTSVAASSDRVRLALSDGASHDADILVAADGLRSSVREMVFPEYPRPHYTGLIGTGGITEAEISEQTAVAALTDKSGRAAMLGWQA